MVVKDIAKIPIEIKKPNNWDLNFLDMAKLTANKSREVTKETPAEGYSLSIMGAFSHFSNKARRETSVLTDNFFGVALFTSTATRLK